MSATDELRRLLDEREVEWFGSYDSDETCWDAGELTWFYTNNGNVAILGVVQADVTPEQAIAATLGNDGVERSNDGVAELRAENDKLRELVRFIMRQCNDGNPRCDDCVGWNGGECVALLRMRELGIEASE